EVMSQRSRRRHALLRECDGRRLPRPDPDGQEPVASYFSQKHDRLVGGHLDPDTHNVELVHTATLGRACRVWVVGPRPVPPPVTADGQLSRTRSADWTMAACSRTDSAASSRAVVSA